MPAMSKVRGSNVWADLHGPSNVQASAKCESAKEHTVRQRRKKVMAKLRLSPDFILSFVGKFTSVFEDLHKVLSNLI